MNLNEQLLKKLLNYKGNKEYYKKLKQQFPKGLTGDIDEIFDLIEFLKENIIIDGQKISEIEPDDYDKYILVYLYFVASRDSMFQIALSSKNYQNIINTIENQLELIAELLKNKDKLEEISQEVQKTEEEKKQENTQSEATMNT